KARASLNPTYVFPTCKVFIEFKLSFASSKVNTLYCKLESTYHFSLRLILSLDTQACNPQRKAIAITSKNAFTILFIIINFHLDSISNIGDNWANLRMFYEMLKP